MYYYGDSFNNSHGDVRVRLRVRVRVRVRAM